MKSIGQQIKILERLQHISCFGRHLKNGRHSHIFFSNFAQFRIKL